MRVVAVRKFAKTLTASGVRSSDQTLGWKPLVHLLIEALDVCFDGTLVLVDELGRRHFVYFEQGVPSQVTTPLSIEPFGRTMRRLGLVGDVVDEAALEGALRIRVMMLVERLFGLSGHTRYRFHPYEDLAPKKQRTPCNALALIMRGLRRRTTGVNAQMVLHDLAGQQLTLQREATQRLIGATRVERAVLKALERRPMTLTELCSLSIGPEPVVRAAVYALHEMRFFARGDMAPPLALPKNVQVVLQRLPSLQMDSDEEVFQRAQKLFRRRRFDDAEKLLLSIARSGHLGGKALLAWLRAERGGDAKASIALLDEVIAQNPRLERARYWRGTLRHRHGQWAKAIEDFRAVLRINPRNVGAEREIKRFEARVKQLVHAYRARKIVPGRPGDDPVDIDIDPAVRALLEDVGID